MVVRLDPLDIGEGGWTTARLTAFPAERIRLRNDHHKGLDEPAI
jgi:hypothetical protein